MRQADRVSVEGAMRWTRLLPNPMAQPATLTFATKLWSSDHIDVTTSLNTIGCRALLESLHSHRLSLEIMQNLMRT